MSLAWQNGTNKCNTHFNTGRHEILGYQLLRKHYAHKEKSFAIPYQKVRGDVKCHIFTLKTVTLNKPSRISNVKHALWRRLIQISAGTTGYHGGFLDFLSPSMQMPRKLTWLATKAFFKIPICHSPTTVSLHCIAFGRNCCQTIRK